MFDVLIRGGTIVDGTGNVGFKGDVAIEADRLKILVGDTSSVQAANTIDASGCIVAPGFIDVHTHSDLIALSEPLNEPKIMQGICTEIVGLDGIGYAPLSKKNLEMMLLLYSGVDGRPKLDYNWSSVAEYLQQFRHKTSANIAYLVPNGCLRAEAVGWEGRPAAEDEIRKMQDMIRQGMAQGAIGLSTGLQYPPGSWATTDELVELCKTVAECGGVYVTHVRYDLGDGVFDGFREALRIGIRSGCPVHISHYFATIPLRGQTARMLQFVDDARASGVDLTFDAYPYEAGSTTMHIAVPQWAHNGGPHELLRRLQNRNDRDRMRGQSSKILGQIEGMVISAVKTEKNKWCEGLTVAATADRLNKDPWDTVCDLMIEEDLEVAFYTFGGDMNDVKVMITHPAHMFCSDGLRIGGMPNPRTYGTYPKILGQLVRDERVLTMEQAIRKMTSFPAQRFGLRDRGILRDGMKADIVVFDPVTVSGVATFANPKQFPLGIEYVFVNGKMVVEKGKHTGALPGEPLTMRGYVGRI
ncbi:MAG TPA: D-aminoacylase [Dehalococcoidia bacterium]|nr:D-aminoacylase [Dehalococcoidia bacterium]